MAGTFLTYLSRALIYWLSSNIFVFLGALVVAIVAFLLYRKYKIGKYMAIIAFFTGTLGVLAVNTIKAVLDDNPAKKKLLILLIIFSLLVMLLPIVVEVLFFVTMKEIVVYIYQVVMFILNILLIYITTKEAFEFKKQGTS